MHTFKNRRNYNQYASWFLVQRNKVCKSEKMQRIVPVITIN